MKRKAVTRSCAMQCLEGSTLSTALPALNTHYCLQPRLLHNMGNTVSIPSLFSRETTRDNSCNKHGMQQASTASTGVNLVTVLTSVGSLECIPVSHILAKHELQALAPEGYGHCWWHTGLESGGPITRGLQGSKAGRTSPCKVILNLGITVVVIVVVVGLQQTPSTCTTHSRPVNLISQQPHMWQSGQQVRSPDIADQMTDSNHPLYTIYHKCMLQFWVVECMVRWFCHRYQAGCAAPVQGSRTQVVGTFPGWKYSACAP